MISLVNISKKIKNNEVLKNISLKFYENKITGLLGNNGAGKTTLLKIIFQELKADHGELLIKDSIIKTRDYLKLHFFTTNNELPKSLTVKQFTRYYLGLKFLKKDFSNKIEELNWIFDYLKFKNLKIDQLSDGEKKMYSLFLMMLIDAEIILFDEPTANLDAKNKNTIISVIKYLKNQNKTIIILTNLLDEICDLLDIVFVMKDGEIVFHDETKNIENIKKTYLEVTEVNSEEDIIRRLENES